VQDDCDTSLPADARCAACGGAHASDAPCPPRKPARTLAFGAPPPLPPAGPPETAGADPLVGSRVGSFQIVRILGRGGMGTVYLAEHPVIGSRVAVKFLHPNMAENPAVVARFYDEARAVNLIGHENIVGIYDLSQLPPNRYYFVMEYLEGETLTDRLGAGRLALPVALDVLLQLCDALQCAHERGVVHRDLKPENVFLVSRRGKSHFVKLLDFGIAKLRDAAGGPGRTSAGLIVGTPEYMAPEQCDDREIDARTDVYSLGVIAFELATGRLPFEGRTVTQLLLSHLQKAPPAPSSFAKDVDPAFEALILRALQKDPAARFPDMAAFAEALRGVHARAAASGAAAPPTPPAVVPPPPAELLRAELRAGAGAARSLVVAELTRAGLFLRADGALPPLRERLQVTLAHSALRAPLEIAAEVVRHVSPADAPAWHLPAGFAAQFVDLTPEARAAIATLADLVHGAPPPAPGPAPAPAPARAPATDARLRVLELRAKETHYGFLGVAADAEFADLRRAVRTARAEIDAFRERPTAPDQPARALALLQRLDAANAAVGAPAARLGYDALRGNWRGVARCVASGVPTALVEARRREFLSANPAREATAERHLARAQVARKLGNILAATLEFEKALEADPLDLGTHELFRAWKAQHAG
jgi:tRNA A-37 threonylcarbamoyl transferase component Bud32